MERIKAILADERFRHYLALINEHEQDRKFCRHGQEHFFAVCRISYILVLEEPSLFAVCREMGLEELLSGVNEGVFLQHGDEKNRQKQAKARMKELVYAAGLLHDIGRWLEYETGEDHALAGGKLAIPILEEAGFLDWEIFLIVTAIKEHRGMDVQGSYLGRVIRRADNLARGCSFCQGKKDCYKVEKMLEQYGNIIY